MKTHAPATIAKAKMPGMTASQLLAAANAPAPPQFERTQRFGKGGDAGRGMSAAKVAAFRLDAKPELDRGGRSGGGEDAQQRGERRGRRDGRERDDEGASAPRSCR